MIPIKNKPCDEEYFDVEKNNSCVIIDPKFPPAPVRPEIRPRARRETKGTMPNVAPQAPWTTKEKRSSATMAMGSLVANPSHMQKTPPRVCKTQRVHSLPLMPKYRAATSER